MGLLYLILGSSISKNWVDFRGNYKITAFEASVVVKHLL